MTDQDQQQQSAHEPMTATRLAAIRARAEARPLLDFGGVEQPGNGPHARKRVQACFADRLALLAFAEAALPILRAVAACEAVRAPTFGLGGIEGIVLHHDSLNVLWMREQARALLAGAGEVSADEGSES